MLQDKKHLHIIGIGGIGISALARYYQHIGYTVSGSDGANSPFIQQLKKEGFHIAIGHNSDNLPDNTDLVIYSEAIITKPDLSAEQQIYANPELAKARDNKIEHYAYPVALSHIFNKKQGIAIAGSHGKSTTTSMVALMLANNSNIISVSPSPGCTAIIGTKVPQLGNTNFYTEPHTDIFVIEACEYKRSFLRYYPHITVITNIDLDHLDYYRDIEDYVSAFQSLVDQTSDFVIISANDINSQKLNIPLEKKIVVDNDHATYFARTQEIVGTKEEIYHTQKTLSIPHMNLSLPGEHILHDAKLAYIVGRLLDMQDDLIVTKLQSYCGAWRRFEIVKTTKYDNILMSDYGHHPNEIRPTLDAIKQQYPDRKLLVIFQPHQYSRTRELIDDFVVSFDAADTLIIPNIYFSRDKQSDVEYMTADMLVTAISRHHPNVEGGGGFQNTAQRIEEYEKNHPDSCVILLLGAGDIDSMRDMIP